MRTELERILASHDFRGSERRSRLLKYLVEKAIAGEPVKEYVIGVDVFDKPSDYDPRIDPAVRVEIGRVRSKLADYYAGAGQANRWRLEFPKRSYTPALRPAEPVARVEPVEQAGRRWMIVALAVAVCATGLAAWRISVAQTRRTPVNPQAQQLSVKARFFWNKRTPESLRTALGLYQEAIRVEPRYAPAYAGEALCYAVMATDSELPADQASGEAKEAAAEAIALEPDSAEAHAALGLLAFDIDDDWKTADAELKRALATDPGFATAHQWRALNLLYSGRAAEASVEIGKALAADPVSMPLNAADGMISYYLRRYQETIEKAHRMLAMDPAFREGHLMLGEALEQRREWDAAEREFHTVALASTGDSEGVARLAHLYALTGRKAKAEEIVDQLLHPLADQYVDPYQLAFIYAATGEKQKALNWLAKAIERHTAIIMKMDPYMDSLRGEPRFQAMLRQVHLD